MFVPVKSRADPSLIILSFSFGGLHRIKNISGKNLKVTNSIKWPNDHAMLVQHFKFPFKRCINVWPCHETFLFRQYKIHLAMSFKNSKTFFLLDLRKRCLPGDVPLLDKPRPFSRIKIWERFYSQSNDVELCWTVSRDVEEALNTSPDESRPVAGAEKSQTSHSAAVFLSLDIARQKVSDKSRSLEQAFIRQHDLTRQIRHDLTRQIQTKTTHVLSSLLHVHAIHIAFLPQ